MTEQVPQNTLDQGNKSEKFSPIARRKSRRYLLQALYQWQITKTPLEELIPQFQRDSKYIEADNRYFLDLLTGIIENHAALDSAFRQWLDRETKSLDFIEHAILWIGAYELKERLDIPYRVIINESIELAKMFGADQSHKYVNGILDRVAKLFREIEVDRSRTAHFFKQEPTPQKIVSIEYVKKEKKDSNGIN